MSAGPHAVDLDLRVSETIATVNGGAHGKGASEGVDEVAGAVQTASGGMQASGTAHFRRTERENVRYG